MTDIKKIAIIGADSYIAGKFIEANDKYDFKLFTIKDLLRHDYVLLNDFFEIKNDDFKDCDVVINFAAIVHQSKLKDEQLYKRINTELPVYLANEAEKAGVKHYIQMSTIAVYGNVNTINENTITQPKTIYGETKLNADIELLKKEIHTSIIRPPMVYGGGKAPGNMMSLIKASLKGIPMPFKDVKNLRDFIHVKNLVKALEIVVDNNINGIIIPTDKKAVSTEEIINTIKKYSNKKVRLIKIPKIFHAIIKNIKPELYDKVFGSLKVVCNLPNELYNPKFNIEDGIKEMINANKK